MGPGVEDSCSRCYRCPGHAPTLLRVHQAASCDEPLHLVPEDLSLEPSLPPALQVGSARKLMPLEQLSDNESWALIDEQPGSLSPLRAKLTGLQTKWHSPLSGRSPPPAWRVSRRGHPSATGMPSRQPRTLSSFGGVRLKSPSLLPCVWPSPRCMFHSASHRRGNVLVSSGHHNKTPRTRWLER